MTALNIDKLKEGLFYTDRIAKGEEPKTGLPVRDDTVINDPDIIRSMYFIKEVLQEVLNNNGIIGGKEPKPQKQPYPLEALTRYVYLEDKSISFFVEQLKTYCPDENIKGIPAVKITNWLRMNGYIEDVYDSASGRKSAIPTEKGIAAGLYAVEKDSRYGYKYKLIMYNETAQKFIVANMERILDGEVI